MTDLADSPDPGPRTLDPGPRTPDPGPRTYFTFITIIVMSSL